MNSVPKLIPLMIISALAGGALGYFMMGSDTGDSVEVPSPSVVVETLPDIQLAGLDGEPLSLSQWDGRARVINFWATWCPPCRREMPLFQALAESRNPDALVVIGIAIDRLAAVNQFVDEFGITYPQLVGEQDAIVAADQFGVESGGLPFTVFAAPGGEVLHLHVGELDRGQLEIILAVVDQVSAGNMSVADARQGLSEL